MRMKAIKQMSLPEQQAMEVRIRALHADPKAYLKKFPDSAIALGVLIKSRIETCNWGDLETLKTRLKNLVSEGELTIPVYNLIGTTAKEQYDNACRYTEWKYAGRKPYKKSTPLHKINGKIRLGYLSSDFHEHATCYLLASLFEHHDRTKFEVYAYSCGVDDHSPMRKRIEEGVDQFIDCQKLYGLDPKKAAQRIEEDRIDILVDLKGYTTANCTDILALRPAPLMVHYLGAPFTTGGLNDYILADSIVIPEKNKEFFSEKVVYLPNSYQINDDKCTIGKTKTKAEYGLPEDSYVYASFNQPYKATSEVFGYWMGKLQQNPKSVLWQYCMSSEALENLKYQAYVHGIDENRIIAARHCSRPDHLARFRVVDAFLDTFPVCGHTTMSDAIRMKDDGRENPLKIILTPWHETAKTFEELVSASLLLNIETLFDAKSKTQQIEQAFEKIVLTHETN